MRKARTLLSLLWLCLPGLAGAELVSDRFASAALGRDVDYVVDLPDSYAQSDRRYPVVYALHGLFEGASFWQSRGLSAILQEFRSRPGAPEFLVVAVSGGNSFFANSPAGHFEDLVTSDLIAEVESSYRVKPGRSGRALLGVSMGGYAALRIAFKQPDAVSAVAAHSAMLLREPPSAQAGARSFQMSAFRQVFGDPIDPKRWAAEDPLQLSRAVSPSAVPALSFDCGDADRYLLYEGNRLLHEILEQRGVQHSFALHPGDHGYEYVRSVLSLSLKFLGDQLSSSSKENR